MELTESQIGAIGFYIINIKRQTTEHHVETCILLVKEREEDVDTVSIKVDLDGIK